MKGIKLISIKLTWGNLPWRKISAISTVYFDSGNACIHFVLFYLTQKYAHQWHFILSEPHSKVGDSFGGRSRSWTASFKPGIQHMFPASANTEWTPELAMGAGGLPCLLISQSLSWPTWTLLTTHLEMTQPTAEHRWASGGWVHNFRFPLRGMQIWLCFSTSL